MARLKSKEAPFQPSGDSRRVIPLQQGWAYIFDEFGKKHHLKRDSDEMVTLCLRVDDAMGGAIRRGLRDLGWDDVLTKMDEVETDHG